uniref:15-oxoprostaglandin 13-reductase n=1 Tax=Strigamia maritima TaxID=126957 RepID=T1IMR1_STRMM
MASLPATHRKLVVKSLSTNFALATEIITEQLPKPKANQVLIKNKFLGINATDINVTAGRYTEPNAIGFVPGLEAIGEIVEIGNEVSKFKVGQPVAYMGIGCSAEYMCVPHQAVHSVPEIRPEYLVSLICGSTACIALDKAGEIKAGDKVLITAAAGGTGHICVQFAKEKGCHVAGLCSSEEKADFLKQIGCDRIIDYKKENLGEVLSREYPTGIDVVWETIGGEVFNQCLDNLAIHARLILIGYITKYKSETGYAAKGLEGLPTTLLWKSASVRGFILNHFTKHVPTYHAQFLESFKTDKIKVKMDKGVFKGLESIASAVEVFCTSKK